MTEYESNTTITITDIEENVCLELIGNKSIGIMFQPGNEKSKKYYGDFQMKIDFDFAKMIIDGLQQQLLMISNNKKNKFFEKFQISKKIHIFNNEEHFMISQHPDNDEMISLHYNKEVDISLTYNHANILLHALNMVLPVKKWG